MLERMTRDARRTSHVLGLARVEKIPRLRDKDGREGSAGTETASMAGIWTSIIMRKRRRRRRRR